MTWRIIASQTPESGRFESFVQRVSSIAGTVIDRQECGDGWLQQVSRFVQDLHSASGDDNPIEWCRGAKDDSRIVIHTITVEDDQVSDATLKLMRCIFKVYWLFCSHCLVSQRFHIPHQSHSLSFRNGCQMNMKYWTR